MLLLRFFPRPVSTVSVFPVCKIPSLSTWSRIRATSFNKQLRKSDESKEAWTRVLQRGVCDVATDLGAVRNINYDTLRLARVRLDAFCCIAFRKYFHSLPVDAITLILYTDGSPQWRGVELLASTVDIFVPGIR